MRGNYKNANENRALVGVTKHCHCTLQGLAIGLWANILARKLGAMGVWIAHSAWQKPVFRYPAKTFNTYRRD